MSANLHVSIHLRSGDPVEARLTPAIEREGKHTISVCIPASGTQVDIYCSDHRQLRELAASISLAADRLKHAQRKEAHGEVCTTDPCGDCQPRSES